MTKNEFHAARREGQKRYFASRINKGKPLAATYVKYRLQCLDEWTEKLWAWHSDLIKRMHPDSVIAGFYW